MSDYNQSIIDEFHANAGKVGGYFANATLLLLTTTGARSSQTRVSPLVYFKDNNRFIIIASAAGADTHPAWYHNLLANPTATIEVGEERFQVKATEIKEPERSQLYAKMVEIMPSFAEYERKTSRKIPVIALERIN